MTLPLEGWSYANGVLSQSGGVVLVEFDPKYNPEAHAALAVGLGSRQSITYLDGTLTIDGTPYVLQTENDDPEVQAHIAELVAGMVAEGLKLKDAEAIVVAIRKDSKFKDKTK